MAKDKVRPGKPLVNPGRNTHISQIRSGRISVSPRDAKFSTSRVQVFEKGNVKKWLGGDRLVHTRIESEFDYITIGSSGITKGSVDELANFVGVTRKDMAERILDISVKTLERKTPTQKLDKRISSHAVEIAKVMQHAYEVFEDEQKVKLWVNTENKSLNGMRPVQLMDTLTGLNMIDEVLGRIEEGIYS